MTTGSAEAARLAPAARAAALDATAGDADGPAEPDRRRLPDGAPAAPAPLAPLAWFERWRVWRDRRIASRPFQRWAAAFWPTRPLVRRRAAGLFDLMAGFVYSQVLLACVRLKLFDLLADGPQTATALAERLALDVAAAERLLAAAVSLRLVERRSGGRFGLGALGAPLVGNAAIAAMVEHHCALYADLRDPVALLRGQGATALADYWPYAVGGGEAIAAGRVDECVDERVDVRVAERAAERAADYSALMSASQPLVADELLDAYPLRRHRRLLDVGGGAGTFVAAVARRAPQLELELFDLPLVADRAHAVLAAQGLAARVRVHAGDFFAAPLPRGADVISLVRVVFDHPDDRALALLRAVRDALPPGGRLLLAEPMAGTAGAAAMGDAYFGFYLLAMGKGRARTAAELSALIERAGFSGVRQLPTRLPLQAGVLIATAA